MKNTVRYWIAGACALAATAIAAAGPARPSVSLTAWAAAGPGVRTVQVSGRDPFTACAALPLDAGLAAGAVEPVVAVNPRDPANIAAAWQQGRDHGVVVGVSFDHGQTWRQVAVPGLTGCTGGAYDYSDDTWLGFGADGTLHLSAHVLSVQAGGGRVPSRSSRLYTRSADGGLTWSAPVPVVPYLPPSAGAYATGSIAADPADPRLVYSVVPTYAYPGQGAVTTFRGTVVFDRSGDGGRNWLAPQVIYDTGPGRLTTGDQILVLPGGDLVDVFTLITDPAHGDMSAAAIRSADHGRTWSAPVVIAALRSAVVTDPQTGVQILAGSADFTSGAVDPRTGRVYVAWQDTRWSGGAVNAIAVSSSADGGRTWTTPVKASQTPISLPSLDQQALSPSVAATNGTVAVAYYDLRASFGGLALLADRWLAICRPAGDAACTRFAREDRLTASSFDMRDAPVASAATGKPCYQLGDYAGLTSGEGFIAASVAEPAGTGDAAVFVSTAHP